MIGVAQDERGVDVLKMFGREGLDRCLRANRREDGSEEVAVRCGEDARAGAVVAGGDGILEHEGNYNGRNKRNEQTIGGVQWGKTSLLKRDVAESAPTL